MKIAPLPDNEADRLQALYRYRILDSAGEAAFDDFTQLAAHICEAPMALITLIDAERQWFKSRVGLDETETPRDVSFCSHAIHGRDVFEVGNALEDDRFADNPLVASEPHIRFYAGTPLITQAGLPMGTLCVLDTAPRQLSPAQKTALSALGRQVVRQMDMRLLVDRERELNLALSRQAQFQKILLDSAMAAVISTTEQGVITSFNPEAERLLGYASDELVGQQALGLFHVEEELLARARELAAQFGRDLSAQEALLLRPRMGESEMREWHYRRKDGSRVPVTVSVAALRDDGGAVAGFVVLAWDITERRRARDRIVRLNADLERRVSARTAELESTTSDLQMLSQSLAHDLRQPLIAMSGYSSLLQNAVAGEREQHYLQRIASGIAQINVRADALLYFANLSRSSLKRETVDLGHIALRCLGALQASEPQRKVKPHVQPGLLVEGDAGLLETVMKELLQNAWRFTRTRPLGILEVGSDLLGSGERAYYVRDNGEGFDMRYASSLFDPFQKLDAAREGSGEGIGLARVKRIIMKHGGRVWVESTEGAGATFYFTLAPP